ncbi:UNVERIFIED_CONTAM: hypothetical protein K2H54_008310 [Gekko kuhli]
MQVFAEHPGSRGAEEPLKKKRGKKKTSMPTVGCQLRREGHAADAAREEFLGREEGDAGSQSRHWCPQDAWNKGAAEQPTKAEAKGENGCTEVPV